MGRIDIFNPKISKVHSSIEGKSLLIYSNENKVGKTAQSARMPKPFYLRFEAGINAVNGLAFADLTSWREFKDVNKQLTDPKYIDQAKEMYQTIIFDTVDVAAKWCESYICSCEAVNDLRQIPYGGGYKKFENEWFNEINKLTNAGYTLIFIAHAKETTVTDPDTNEEYVQMVPFGSTRDIKLIRDLCDLIGFVKSNGLDTEGNEIPSSIYFVNTKYFVAGSRFKYMPKVVKPFTAENLQAVIKEAIEKEEAESGKGITYAEFKASETVEKMPFEELMNKVGEAGTKLAETKGIEVLQSIVEEVLGTGKKVSACTEKQYEAVATIYDMIQDALNG